MSTVTSTQRAADDAAPDRRHPRTAAAEGHRVVTVVASDEMGPVQAGGSARPAELRASAAVLGTHRVEHLGTRAAGTAGKKLTLSKSLEGGGILVVGEAVEWWMVLLFVGVVLAIFGLAGLVG